MSIMFASTSTTFHLFLVTLTVLISAFLTSHTTAINLKNLVSWYINRGHDNDRPNNNYDELIAAFGEEGYRALVSAAMGNTAELQEEHRKTNYGVDVSYPIHHAHVSTATLHHGSHVPLGDKQAFYESSIQGCRTYYGTKYADRCDEMEYDRINMNLRQPTLMVNYTALGFQKIKAPAHLQRALVKFWENNQQYQSKEKWSAGNTYTNHWHSPTYMINLEDPRLPGGGNALKSMVFDTTEKILHQWIAHGQVGLIDENSHTGESHHIDLKLVPTSLYGIRVYKKDSVLAPHVDRLPLVVSAIINVAQDVDEDWPLEVYGHDGRVYNVTMEPGDMVLYESHSIIHGRPFPFNGRYFANVFVHFEPKGYSQRFYESFAEGNGHYQPAKRHYREVMKQRVKVLGSENDKNEVPIFVEKGGIEEKLWGPKADANRRTRVVVDSGTMTAHQAAALGDLDAMISMVAENPETIHRKDKNGWQPIHEAARGGHTKVVEYLIENGADVNTRTNGGFGGTPLFWAKHKHGPNHECVKLLEKNGAKVVEPEL